METKAVFRNIQDLLERAIAESAISIKVVVAWFTNTELLASLIDKLDLNPNINIEIIISDDIINKKVNTQTIRNKGGSLSVLQTEHSKFLHEKFAIFDDSKVIVGSYNWTYGAEYKNHESVIVSTNKDFVNQYNIRYKQLAKYASVFSNEILNISTSPISEAMEDEFIALEKKLENELRRILIETEKIKIGIYVHNALDMISTLGAVSSLKRIMSKGTKDLQSGFTKLLEHNRPDLTFESVLLKEPFKVLFDEKTIQVAQERLKLFKSATTR